MNTDGNLAALHQYERDQDALEAEDLNIEDMQHNLAIDLWEAYVTGNHAVIDEIDDSLTDTDTTDNLINRMRQTMSEECRRPSMGRGPLMYRAYDQIIDAVCRGIASRYTTGGEIEAARREYGL